jgi:hypothetical protein
LNSLSMNHTQQQSLQAIYFSRCYRVVSIPWVAMKATHAYFCLLLSSSEKIRRPPTRSTTAASRVSFSYSIDPLVPSKQYTSLALTARYAPVKDSIAEVSRFRLTWHNPTRSHGADGMAVRSCSLLACVCIQIQGPNA